MEAEKINVKTINASSLSPSIIRKRCFWAYSNVDVMEQLKNYFLKLNIFQESSDSNQQVNEDPYEQRTQIIATRVYLVLLVLTLITFLLFICLESEKMTVTIQNPTLAQIESLPIDRICPCSNISFSYDKFVSSNVSFHQVCSSDFVSDRWIASLFYGIDAGLFLQNDFRSVGFAQFRALASFCQLSQTNVNQILSLFGSSLFISTHFDSSPTNLRTNVIASLNRFRSSISSRFKSQIQLISSIILGNNFLNALGTSIVPNKNLATMFQSDKEVGYYIRQYRGNSSLSFCYCTANDAFEYKECQGFSGIYEEHFDIDINTANQWYVPTVSLPNFVSSCMPVDSCLLSSLECFYNQTCIDAIFPYQKLVDGVRWNFTALNSNNASKLSRFNTNSIIKSIVDELMVEEWNVQEFHDKYSQQCVPTVCTYLTDIYPDFLSVLNAFIGLLGGLCTVLRIIILPVVRFIRRRLWPLPASSESSQSLPIPCTYNSLSHLLFYEQNHRLTPLFLSL
jgi:hypothetical protein